MTLYVSDLDGTLINYECKLKPRTVEMLNRFIRKGVMFSFATARSIATAKPIFSEVELKLPVITMNGVAISDPKTGEIIYKSSYTDKMKAFTMEALRKQGAFPLVYAFIDGEKRVSYVEKEKKHVKYYLDMRKGDKRMRPCDTFEELFEGEVYYVTVLGKESDTAPYDELFTAANGFGHNYQKDSAFCDIWWYEIFNIDASKANAVLRLKEMTGADEVVTFGDNISDISMLKAADRSYAVENAIPEAKAAAMGIVPSNEEQGVTRFIDDEITQKFSYNKQPHFKEPDSQRFAMALEQASARERTTIGTLSEKLVHSTLKHYFTGAIDHEAKIGAYYADAVSENGIYEIQTRAFGKLCPKLECFLDLCHVTVVYPYSKRIRNTYINENTGEVIKTCSSRTNKNLSDFFLELYRIKSFISNKNLTLCIAELEEEKLIYVDDERCLRKRGQRKELIPKRLLREVYFESAEDYARLLPQLPSKFDRKEFAKLVDFCDASLLLNTLEYLSIVHKVEIAGNAFIYSADEKYANLTTLEKPDSDNNKHKRKNNKKNLD